MKGLYWVRRWTQNKSTNRNIKNKINLNTSWEIKKHLQWILMMKRVNIE